MHSQGHAGLDPGARGVLLALAWLSGVAIQLQMPALWHVGTVAATGGVATLVGAGAWRWRRRSTGLLVLVAALSMAGFSATHTRAAWRLADSLPAALEGVDLVVTGIVSELPQASLTGARFVLDVEHALRENRPVVVPQRLSLGWYRSAETDALVAAPPVELRAGQRWQLTVRLRQPHGSFNPHGFDLELWLFEQNLRASGTVRATAANVNRLLSHTALHPIQQARQRLRDAIDLHVDDTRAAGVLAALAVGDQAAIDRADWDLFRTTGVAHLMSISGLHVTMFAWLAAGLAGWCWRRSPRLLHACPAPRAAAWAGLALATAYALLAGWGVPAQRTVWMLAVVVGLRSLGLRWPVPAVLLAAAVVVTALDPWALLQPGFWLSFMAVGLLMASEPVACGPMRPAAAGGLPPWALRLWATVRRGLRTQLIATVGLAPLSMLFFQQVSVVGFLANLVAIPLVTLLITPLALLGVWLAPFWTVAAWLVQGLCMPLQWLAAWPGAVWTAAAAPPWAVACGVLAALLALLPLPWRLRALAVPLMLPLLWPAVSRPPLGQFELVAADVGQGTAVLLRTRNHLLVYDTGPQYMPGADAGARVLLPLLRARGERAVDLLVISHRDSDHVGGAASLVAGLPVGALMSSLREDHPLRATGLPHTRCDAGQAWDWDGVRFEVLHPLASDHAMVTQSNALSCVIRVQAQVQTQTQTQTQAHAIQPAHSVLLAGDIEAAQEAALLQRSAPGALASTVLLVPHHGSRTSSTAGFIDAVSPRTAVVQAAYRSRYGHPAADVVRRYTDCGITVVRTDHCGAWSLKPFAAGVCERQAARRYWHHPGASAHAVNAGPLNPPNPPNRAVGPALASPGSPTPVTPLRSPPLCPSMSR